MSFESFRVELRSDRATFAQVDELVRNLPQSKPDCDSILMKGSSYYTVEDGSHVIEIEVADSPVTVSCRFTLCHPPTIDAAFLGLVRELMDRLGLEVRICDDVAPEHAHAYPATHFAEFAEVALATIAVRRAEWAANFGPSQFPASTVAVYEKVILPRCVPVVGFPA